MRFRSFMRRTCVALACVAALAAAPIGPSAAREDGPRMQAVAAIAALRGGWAPRHLNACAFSVGLMSGGIAGLPINPMGGATAFAIGLGIALFSCP